MNWQLVSESSTGSKLYTCGEYAKKECWIAGELRIVVYKLNKCKKENRDGKNE